MLAIDDTEFITVGEAAVRAGVSVQTVYRAVKGKQLQYRRRRGAIKLLSRLEVERWIVSRETIEENES